MLLDQCNFTNFPQPRILEGYPNKCLPQIHKKRIIHFNFQAALLRDCKILNIHIYNSFSTFRSTLHQQSKFEVLLRQQLYVCWSTSMAQVWSIDKSRVLNALPIVKYSNTQNMPREISPKYEYLEQLSRIEQ